MEKAKHILFTFIFTAAAILSCSKKDAETAKKTRGKTMIIYFSMPETTKARNMTREEDNSVVVVDGKVLGNTQYVAYVIKDYTGGNIFRIEPEKPYPVNHQTLVDLAYKEQQKNAKPKLKTKVKNIELYDTVFIGYPNWWGDMPMILYTFFDTHDLSGKKIIPFNTHGGSGFSDTINTITRLEPKARVEKNGYSVSRNTVHKSRTEIIAWLKKLGF